MRIVHFELPADDPGRCRAFYEKTFGWTFQKWDGPMDYWTVKTGDAGPGIDGGMMKRQQPGQPGTNVIAVDSVDAIARAIAANGGSEVVPKMAVPGVGWTAYFMDTEHNMFGVIQFDPGAK
ncbi:MAG: VOC family protein [Vicinamibacterales bacterium]